MGEYAEMMLDGTCCQYCGQPIDTDAGFPQTCRDCAADIKTKKVKTRNKKEYAVINGTGTGIFDVETVFNFPKEYWENASEKKKHNMVKSALLNQMRKGYLDLKINTIDYRVLKYSNHKLSVKEKEDTKC